eukprot:Hpha_TRINITY_DN14143_c0_g1::TRINITY_DN14143_c0_g1_i1::g.10730::m.10730
MLLVLLLSGITQPTASPSLAPTNPTCGASIVVKSALLSGIYKGSAACNADQCINGLIRKPCPSSGCCGGGVEMCHSAFGTATPWLRLGFAVGMEVSCVEIFNRQDCCADRLGHYIVYVGNNIGTITSNTNCLEETGASASVLLRQLSAGCSGEYLWLYLPQASGKRVPPCRP